MNVEKALITNMPWSDIQGFTLGEKSYISNDSGKGFSCQDASVMHYRIHTGEKPYICPKCGKDFPRKESLDLHSRIYISEKPY